MSTPVYKPRSIDSMLADLLTTFPAVLVNGPRAAGKTTSARQHAATVVRLDQSAQAAAFRADPDGALRDRVEPILLDEWQEVPDVMGRSNERSTTIHGPDVSFSPGACALISRNGCGQAPVGWFGCRCSG